MIYLLAFPPPVSITIAAVGDVMLGRYVEARIKREGDAKALAGVKSTLKKADLVLGNLECPLTNEPFALQKPVLLKASPERAQALKGIFSALSLANNHSLDCGTKGLHQTEGTLAKNGIGIIGSGISPWITFIKDTKIGVLGVTEFEDPSLGRASEAVDLIRAFRPKVRLLIVTVHWGMENQTEPTQKQRQWAKEWSDAGADIIIGHHPHVWQPVQWIRTLSGRKTLVMYSLGDFLFDSPVGPRRNTGLAMIQVKDEKVTGYEIKKAHIENGFPTLG